MRPLRAVLEHYRESDFAADLGKCCLIGGRREVKRSDPVPGLVEIDFQFPETSVAVHLVSTVNPVGQKPGQPVFGLHGNRGDTNRTKVSVPPDQLDSPGGVAGSLLGQWEEINPVITPRWDE